MNELSSQLPETKHVRYGNNLPRRRRWHLLGFGSLSFLLVGLATGCARAPAGAPEKKAVEVVVTTPVTSRVTDHQDFTGRLDGFKTVDVRSRASGFVLSAPFKEGDLVKEGDLLFQIDPQSYRADLNLAEANLRVAKADSNLQQKNAYRAQVMIGNRSMSREDYDTAEATRDKSKATVEAMKATRDRNQLYLDWTRVTAPLTGRISRRFVDPGNLVTADETVLTTIVSDERLNAYFDVDERTYLDLVGLHSSAKSAWLAGLQFPVQLRLANEEQFARTGVVDFIDNRVNAGTGTIRMRAVFDNPQGLLRAGLFVRIRLPVGSPYEAFLIPDEAVQSDQGRHYVYVVDEQSQVVYRPVTLGQELQGLRVIKQGLSGGERVIVSGMQRVRPKAEVVVKVQAPPKLGGDKETRKQMDKPAQAGG